MSSSVGTPNGEGARGGATKPASAAKSPNRSAILAVAIELLKEHGSDGFTIDDVLVESGTSASSLYHHFGNREGLVLAAQQERYGRTMKGEDRSNLDGGYAARTTEEFCDYVAAQLRRIVTDPANLEVRRNRLEVAARALHSAELAAGAAKYQNEMLDVITEVFTDAQARGLIDRHLDARAYCTWFHSMTLGRTFTEGGAVDAEAWLRVAIPAALAPLIPTEQAPAPSDQSDEGASA